MFKLHLFFIKLHLFIVFIFGGGGMSEDKLQESFLPPCGFWVLNLSGQPWLQALAATEPARQPESCNI